MKLLIITAITEFEKEIKQQLKKAKVSTFSYKNVIGYRDNTEDAIESNWFSGEMNKSLFSFKINNKEFTVKSAEQFLSKIKLNQIPFDDYRDIVMDEAFVLGKIHAKSLGPKVFEYIQSWATIPAASVDEQIIGQKYRLMDMKNNK